MNCVHLAIIGVLLITAGLGMEPARIIHLPLVVQGERWAVPASPPVPQTGVQIFEPHAVPLEYAAEYQHLLEQLEAARQDHTVVYGPGVHGLSIRQGVGDSHNLDENVDGNADESLQQP